MATCNNCGEQYSSNFCPNCGKAARSGEQTISNTFWKGSDFQETVGFVSTLVRIASNPIQNTLSIASSVAFNQKVFLMKCIGISAAIGVLSKVQTTNNLIASIISTGGVYVSVFIQIVLSFYGFRMFSSALRTGGDFARLICIVQGIAFLFLGVGQFLGLTFGPEVLAWVTIGSAIIIVPYWAVLLGRFWNMNATLAYLIYLVSSLPATGVGLLILPILDSSVSFK